MKLCLNTSVSRLWKAVCPENRFYNLYLFTVTEFEKKLLTATLWLIKISVTDGDPSFAYLDFAPQKKYYLANTFMHVTFSTDMELK